MIFTSLELLQIEMKIGTIEKETKKLKRFSERG